MAAKTSLARRADLGKLDTEPKANGILRLGQPVHPARHGAVHGFHDLPVLQATIVEIAITHAICHPIEQGGDVGQLVAELGEDNALGKLTIFGGAAAEILRVRHSQSSFGIRERIAKIDLLSEYRFDRCQQNRRTCVRVAPKEATREYERVCYRRLPACPTYTRSKMLQRNLNVFSVRASRAWRLLCTGKNGGGAPCQS